MFDSVNADTLPADASYLAGYTDGRWPDYGEIRARWPRAQVLSVTVFASQDADALDVETGDATPDQAPGWFERQRARGIARPCIYANASTMAAGVIPAMRAAGIDRSAVRLWSAHYTDEAHICGPASCREVSIGMDGTQWTDSAAGNGGPVDESLLLASFFAVPAAPAAPPSKPAVAEWTTAGQDSLAQLASAHGAGVSTVLRLTVQHSPGSLFPPEVAAWLDQVFAGKADPVHPMPAGLRLFLPG